MGDSNNTRGGGLARARRAGSRLGFTLMEILVVVVILGIIASAVVASVGDSSRTASQNAFISTLNTFTDAAVIYRARTGMYPEDSSSGVAPAGLAPFLDTDAWENGTPIGGVWDAELNSYGVVSAIGVHFDDAAQAQDDAYMTEVDMTFDDGDLTTGSFRRLDSGRYYYVLAF